MNYNNSNIHNRSSKEEKPRVLSPFNSKTIPKELEVLPVNQTIGTLFTSILFLWGFISILTLVHFSSFRKEAIESLDFLSEEDFIRVGNSIAIVLFILFGYNLFKFYKSPSRYENISSPVERRLLGLSELNESSSSPEEKISFLISYIKSSLPTLNFTQPNSKNGEKKKEESTKKNEVKKEERPTTPSGPTYVSGPLRSPLSPTSSYYYIPASSPNTATSPFKVVASNSLLDSEVKSPKKREEHEADLSSSELDRFINIQKQKESVRQKVDQSLAQNPIDPFHGSTPVPRYQVAYKPLPRSSPSKGAITQEEFEYLNRQAAEDALNKYGITNSIPNWVERMRLWIASMVLKPFVKRMNAIEQMGLPLTNNQIPQLVTASFGTLNPQQQQQNDVARERQDLERYMSVLGSTSREYLVKRYRELAEGNYMRSFNWNGGGTLKEKEWSPEFPTDSQLVMHLFSSYMDSTLKENFSSKFIVTPPESLEVKRNHVFIYQRSVHPPHFEVYTPDPFAVNQGTYNVFLALSLFVFWIDQKHQGYLSSVSLSSKQLALASVIQ
eukprot:TRINITY_DN13712_c0_g1_i1.p1 TRINITY_DN13712_c0_g1~~TRINITY_DN13712_c0_g1_i1.p1  ORF type:complete len:592 (-),score=177.45 TRINITY_DN13712_c0_g1_i1:45-1709(-)